ncbi:hypothetical protein IHE45_15G061500 [Dioscorea alata]|uniref:Uncharacterized protein n=1 Tax=Dioscorea alata TaxID=55571 RepID=A0ACB7ULW4_DIOAL|nr:hypothetical protein IHE45_15G061500 [Dioscorea alata]
MHILNGSVVNLHLCDASSMKFSSGHGNLCWIIIGLPCNRRFAKLVI